MTKTKKNKYIIVIPTQENELVVRRKKAEKRAIELIRSGYLGVKIERNYIS